MGHSTTLDDYHVLEIIGEGSFGKVSWPHGLQHTFSLIDATSATLPGSATHR